uniref:Ubiquitin-like domain-containing protein n=1 Tax=Labrus bergylta TaxID=56723 RepID=A0A3Q3ESL0_9LABR
MGPLRHFLGIDFRQSEGEIKMTQKRHIEKMLTRFGMSEFLHCVFVNVGEGDMRLILTDKELQEDSKVVCDYGVQHISIIMMVLRVKGGLSAYGVSSSSSNCL